MKNEEKIESCPVIEFTRIERDGRLKVPYDQRAKYNFNIEDYNRTMNDRKHISNVDELVDSKQLKELVVIDEE